MNHSTVLRSPHDGRRFTNVVLLLTGQTLSLFGSSIVQYAIFRYLVLRSNSGMVMTGAMVAAALPQAIVSVSGGASGPTDGTANCWSCFPMPSSRP